VLPKASWAVAFTFTALPAVWLVGERATPNWRTAPTVTAMLPCLPVMVLLAVSVAVTVGLPAVLSVTVKTCVPRSAAPAPRPAPVSARAAATGRPSGARFLPSLHGL
jgi:hypothetical protein